MPVGDIGVQSVGFDNGRVRLMVEVETTEVRFVDGDEYPTVMEPLRFAYVNTQPTKRGTVRGFKFDGGVIDEKYVSTSRVEWHLITRRLRPSFSDRGISGGWGP